MNVFFAGLATETNSFSSIPTAEAAFALGQRRGEAVFADRGTEQGHGLGRHTMPEMIEYSTVMAIYTLWLVARAEGVGLGWVSILDPAEIGRILDVPPGWSFIGYLCVGYPEHEAITPELEHEGWERRRKWQSWVLRR